LDMYTWRSSYSPYPVHSKKGTTVLMTRWNYISQLKSWFKWHRMHLDLQSSEPSSLNKTWRFSCFSFKNLNLEQDCISDLPAIKIPISH
jgi:hypothetical protein